MKFGDKLIQLRKKKGLSQEELGEKLNVTRQTISKWELNQSKPDTDKLIEISKLLNVDFNQLADDELTIENNFSDTNIDSNELQPRRWLLIVLIIMAIIIVIVLANKVITDNKSGQSGIFNFFNSFFSDFTNFREDMDKDSFNNTFEMRAGTQYGSFVSLLLDDVITNNKTNADHIIEVVFDDVTTSNSDEIKNMKKDLGTFSQYEISLDYDENGYVNKATIEKTSNTSDFGILSDIEIKQFNNKFEMSAGTQYGSFVSSLLDDVITNNKTNPDHILKVIYGNINTTDENEIRNMKKNLDNWTKYEVIFDYDENGYIVQVTIEN